MQATKLEQRPRVLLGSRSAGHFEIVNRPQGNVAGARVCRRRSQARDRLVERLARRTSHAHDSRPLTLATCIEAAFFGTKRVRPISAHHLLTVRVRLDVRVPTDQDPSAHMIGGVGRGLSLLMHQVRSEALLILE